MAVDLTAVTIFYCLFSIALNLIEKAVGRWLDVRNQARFGFSEDTGFKKLINRDDYSGS